LVFGASALHFGTDQFAPYRTHRPDLGQSASSAISIIFAQWGLIASACKGLTCRIKLESSVQGIQAELDSGSISNVLILLSQRDEADVPTPFAPVLAVRV
jgi:hypothetical protein